VFFVNLDDALLRIKNEIKVYFVAHGAHGMELVLRVGFVSEKL